MRLNKSLRVFCFALALVFCIGGTGYSEINVASAKTHEYTEPSVRVGIYVSAPLLDSRMFSSLNTSASGFEIGYASGDSFKSLFSISEKTIILLPQVNASFDGSTCKPNENGNIGAYSAVMGSYSTASAALSAAKSMGGFVAVVNGGYELRKFASNSESAAKSASGNRPVAKPASNGITVVDAGTGKILFTFEDTSRVLAIRGKNGNSVNLPMLHRTGAVNYFDYLGHFEYSVSESKLWMVNVLGLEDYTKCVMANEIGTNVSVETRKAFSVLARTVPLGSKHNKRGYDVCNNSSCCQVYYGLHRMSEQNNQIVDSTRGLFCAYQGKPITVLYHNSNGGASCSSVAAWGGEEVPYLTSVFLEESGEGDTWEKVFTKQEFYEYLISRRAFSSLSDDDISMKILGKDPYGSDYITILSVSDGSGNVITVETSEDIRTACGFTSANFELEYSADVTVVTGDGKIEKRPVAGVMTSEGYKAFEGFDESYKTPMGMTVEPQKVTVDGAGVGHGVGFSAVGSEKLAKDGYSYKYILTFFFNGTTLEYAG